MDTTHSNSASVPLTAWAQKYGPMRDNKGVVISHKSGFTPIDIAFRSTTPLSKNEQLETHRMERFQRHELYGFTTNELAHIRLPAIARLASRKSSSKCHIADLAAWELGDNTSVS